MAVSIAAFLRDQPGKAFCVRCLGRILVPARDIAKTAMYEIEGIGVERRHARCSVCGEKRLVAGVVQ
jgi:ribosomal protein S27AE